MFSFFDTLFSTHRNRIAVTAFISIVIFSFTYGLSTLNPTNISWLLTVKHDWGTNYLGWHFFKNESWHFPLGRIANYFAPLGTNIGFTDSIPLLAVPLKLISFMLPQDFQYFGWWFLFCYFMVGYFTVRLLQLFHVKGIYIFLAVILSVANPVLLYRGMHPALCAHGLLIACLYLYFKKANPENIAMILRNQLLLLLLSSWINPYLCFMVLGFSVALLLKLFWADKLLNLTAFIKQLVVSVGLLLILWFLLGLISFNNKEGLSVSGGYGLYGMNLNSLYNSDGYSAFLPQLKQVSKMQYEGYMYLGLGMMLLIAFSLLSAAIVSFRNTSSGIRSFFTMVATKQYIPLVALLLFFAVFAITHVVSINERVLITIPLPDFLIKFGDVFWASARFFWPVYYLLFLSTIIYWANSKWKTILKASVLSLVVVVQMYDIKLFFTHRKMTYGTYTPPIDIPSWTNIINQFDTIVIYPPFTASYKENMDYQYFCYLAAKLQKPITTGYVAGFNNRDASVYIDSLNDRLSDGMLPENNLYITTPAYAKSFSGARLNVLDGYCFLFNENIKELTLINAADEINARNKKLLDSVKKIMQPPFSFINNTSLPQPITSGIRYMVEGVKKRNRYISIKGWAFKEGTDNNRGDSVFVTLISPLQSYSSALAVNPRADVTVAFKKTYLDDAGFIGNVYHQSVLKGVYRLGLMIKTADGRLFHQLTEEVVKIGIPEYGTMQPIETLPQQGDITSNLEHTDVTDSLIKISGWGFLNGQTAQHSEIYFVLIKDNAYYITATEPFLRPDVTAYYKNSFNVDNCGFMINYLKSRVPKGKYKTGIIIKDILSGKERAHLFANEIEVN